jgi:hypothetical protein
MRRLVIVVMLIVVALGVGLWLGTRTRDYSAYERARSALDIELARTMLPFRVAFRVSLGAVLLSILGGAGWGAIRWLHRRANTVYADRAGLYPIREDRIGRARVFHDPNRVLTGSTVYGITESGIEVQHSLPKGQIQVQQQVTGQAQVAQALRAAVSGDSPLDFGAGVPTELGANQGVVSSPLPDVELLDMEPSHIQRLLLEDGIGGN